VEDLIARFSEKPLWGKVRDIAMWLMPPREVGHDPAGYTSQCQTDMLMSESKDHTIRGC
jgi:hypothetical protein